MKFKRNLAAALTFFATMLFASAAFAVEGAAAAAAGGDGHNQYTVQAAIAIATGLGLGIAAVGGALAQGKAAAAALEGIGRNPAAAKELFTPMLLSLALIESLVIYSLVISFILSGKL